MSNEPRRPPSAVRKEILRSILVALALYLHRNARRDRYAQRIYRDLSEAFLDSLESMLGDGERRRDAIISHAVLQLRGLFLGELDKPLERRREYEKNQEIIEDELRGHKEAELALEFWLQILAHYLHDERARLRGVYDSSGHNTLPDEAQRPHQWTRDRWNQIWTALFEQPMRLRSMALQALEESARLGEFWQRLQRNLTTLLRSRTIDQLRSELRSTGHVVHEPAFELLQRAPSHASSKAIELQWQSRAKQRHSFSIGLEQVRWLRRFLQDHSQAWGLYQSEHRARFLSRGVTVLQAEHSGWLQKHLWSQLQPALPEEPKRPRRELLLWVLRLLWSQWVEPDVLRWQEFLSQCGFLDAIDWDDAAPLWSQAWGPMPEEAELRTPCLSRIFEDLHPQPTTQPPNEPTSP